MNRRLEQEICDLARLMHSLYPLFKCNRTSPGTRLPGAKTAQLGEESVRSRVWTTDMAQAHCWFARANQYPSWSAKGALAKVVSNSAPLRINCSAWRDRDRRYRLSIKGVLKTDFFFCKIIEVLLLKAESGVSDPLLPECSL
jgi:hypothetical protein